MHVGVRLDIVFDNENKVQLQHNKNKAFKRANPSLRRPLREQCLIEAHNSFPRCCSSSHARPNIGGEAAVSRAFSRDPSSALAPETYIKPAAPSPSSVPYPSARGKFHSQRCLTQTIANKS